MKKLVLLAVAAALSTPVMAADLVTKAPDSGPWDVAFGAAFLSDYNFRGVTQSNHKPAVLAYLEPRFNATKNLQFYLGVGAESISFPNRAAAEIDFSAGVRPTFGKLTLDLGVWYYWYPGGQCFNNLAIAGPDCWTQGALPVNGNVIKSNMSFYEFFLRASVAVTDQFSFGGAVNYSPSVMNSGAKGTFVVGNVKFTAPSAVMAPGWGAYVSAEVGHWFLGTTDAFYCTQDGVAAPAGACILPYPNGIPYKSYTTWNVGFGITKSVFTLDFRYYDTDLNQGDCNAFTSDHTARFNGSFTPINPGGFGSNWCDKSFILTGKFDLTAIANLK